MEQPCNDKWQVKQELSWAEETAGQQTIPASSVGQTEAPSNRYSMLVDTTAPAEAEPLVITTLPVQEPGEDTTIAANQETTEASSVEPAPERRAYVVREAMLVDLNEDEDTGQEETGQHTSAEEMAAYSAPLMQPKAKKKSKTKGESLRKDAEDRQTHEDDSGVEEQVPLLEQGQSGKVPKGKE